MAGPENGSRQRPTLDTADVFVTNIRPGALARLHLDYETLAARNSRLVYGLIGGYSATGAAADSEGEIATATRTAKRQIAFYGSTPAYRPLLDHHGGGDCNQS